jgi:hypothetical protein
MPTALKPKARDLDADLAICEAAGRGPWVVAHDVASQVRQPNVSNRRRVVCPPDANGINDATFIAEARQGWPYAIRLDQKVERENDRLRNELDALKIELNQYHRSGCYD